MGEYRQIDYFLVNDELKEIIQVTNPTETQPPRRWLGTQSRKVNTWKGIEEAADLIADYKWIPYREYKADILGRKLEKEFNQGVKV